MKDFSVIIPVYNVEKYIEECIQSVIDQECDKSCEIIVVDDGSKDNSINIVREKFSDISNLKIVQQENKGLSSARNTGMINSTGKYIMFLDSDDYFKKDFCQRMYDYIDNNNLDVVFASYEHFFDDGRKKVFVGVYDKDCILSKDECINNLLSKKTFRAEVCDDIYRREFLEKNNISFTEGIINEDEEFTTKVIVNSTNVGYLNYCGYMYRQREGSITKKVNNKKTIESRIILLNNFIDMFNKQNSQGAKDLILWRVKCLVPGFLSAITESGEQGYDISKIVKFFEANCDKKELYKFTHTAQYVKYSKLKDGLKNSVKKLIRR